ncbi:sensor histidine kinase [Telluria aromaticivorans]|uniref:histidine kinase n=1 Tax=Telluria aromaticivorans TaxID=2725995 RepID=A0A7Y2P008_9BURK|nr:HAMP domain-containing sensor histidine kinase [Telluria aromaticivorans]NNG22334.1 HAMP domain-containing histidine kinase [Telluria aromaticivorans]
MRLSTFILSELECILQEWEDFASTIEPLVDANKKELRDHAAAVLKVIAADLDTPQCERESIAKSKGLGPQAADDTAAEIHGADRVSIGFTGEQVMAEYRALRSSVLRLWAGQVEITTAGDIQDMIRFNEAIDQAQTESMARYAQMLREAQNVFLAILGHDVRSPLGAISMGAQVLLQDQTLPSQALKVALRIFNSTKRMDAIVRDLLDFSTSHLGDGIPVDPITVDLLEICHGVVEEAHTFHPDRKIELLVEGDLTGVWDGDRMSQVFANLVSNAIQHGKPGSVVKVSIRGLADEVVYEVKNDGDLIAPARLRTLFDPVKRFAIRPPNERVRAGSQNLGLGLYVVKEIVAAHKGEVSVTSSETDGVIFSVRIPRVIPHRRSND